MDTEDSLDDSQDNESVREEEGILPEVLDEEFYSQLSQKSNNIIKFLQAAGEFDHSTDIQKLYVTCQRLKKDNLAREQEIENMNSEIEIAKQKLTQALTISKVDYATISRLKISTEDAWKQTDAAHAREQFAQEQLHLIREKLDNIESDNNKLAGRKEGGDELVSNLASHKDTILKERDRLSAEVDELNRRLQIQRLYTEEIERKRTEVETKNKELYKLLDDVSGEAYKEKRLIDSVKERLAAATADNLTLIEEIKELKSQSDSFVKSNVQQNMQILALKTNLERATGQSNSASGKLAKYAADIEQLNQTKEKLQHELSLKNNLLKLKEDESTKIRNDLIKIEKQRDNLVRKLQTSEQLKTAAETELFKFKNQVSTHNKEQNENQKLKEENERKLQMIIRERNSLQNEMPRLQRKVNDGNETIMLLQHEIKSLKDEIKNKTVVELKQKGIISKIEIERDRNAEETQILEDKIDSLNEEIHLKEEYILELKESMNELNANLVKMQTLFETARGERNSFQRNLQTCTDEKNDLKNKYTISNRKIEQYKEVMNSKEVELLRSQKNLDKIEKEFQKIRLEYRNLEVILQNTRSELKEKKIENERLYKTLSADEIRLAKIRKQFDSTTHEKDLIGTQLIRRNDEMTLLIEKINVLQAALDRGEKQYAERIEDIRLLKIEIGNLRSQRNILTRGLANTCDMRQEVLQLHRNLNQERVKAKALQEEMLTPMNVHRWRTLSGKDPEKMALIMKIQSLQKRMLTQAVIATERESSLQAAHKLYSSLKDFMLKLPSYKVKERLIETQHALIVRDKKLKALAAELNAKETDDKTNECVVEELRSNLENTKKELIREKKRKQKLLKEREIFNQIHSYSAPTSCVRTMGSGFKMTLNT